METDCPWVRNPPSRQLNIDRTWRAFAFEGAVRNSLGEMKN